MIESSIEIIVLILINIMIWIVLSLIPKIKNKGKIFLVLSFISLWVFLFIREPYSDMIKYERYFQSINTNNFTLVLENRWETLFKVLLFGIRLITDNTNVMMGIIAFITLAGPFLFIKRYSNNYMLAVVMFIAAGSFHLHFAILRQSIALSIFLAFFYLISERKAFKYCIVILIASLFHKTALVLLLLYPIINIPPSRIKNIVMSCVAAIVLVFSPQISNYLMSDLYSSYVEKVLSGAGIKLLLFYVALYVIYTIISKMVHDKEKEEITKTSIFTILMQLLTIQNNAFSRITTYTCDSFCIMIPNVIKKLNSKDKMLFSTLVIAICLCFIIVTGTFSNYSIGFNGM